MPRLTSISFEHKRSRYSLEFDLDDEAIMKDELSVDLVAKVTDEHGREFKEVLTVVMNFDTWQGEILRGGKTIAKLDLGTLYKLEMSSDEDGPDDPNQPPDGFGNFIDSSVGKTIEEGIGLIPVDPIFGCFIKAGISALVGQACRCHNKIPDSVRRGRRVRAIGRCLIDSAGGIFTRAGWRAARCMLTFGMS